jgi:hypothetical protein
MGGITSLRFIISFFFKDQPCTQERSSEVAGSTNTYNIDAATIAQHDKLNGFYP